MELAEIFLWIGIADSESVVENLTESKYSGDEDNYESWFEKSFKVLEYNQSFRSIGIRQLDETMREFILSMSYGLQYVDQAIEDVNTVALNQNLDGINIIFCALDVEYDEAIKRASTDGLELIFVNRYKVNL